MSLEDSFPIEFEDADVQLHRVSGGIEVLIEHEKLNRNLVVYQAMPDMVDEQLLEEGLVES